MDNLGRGSIIGMDSILLEREWSYSAKVKSKRAHIIQIDIEVLQYEMKFSPILQDKVNSYYNDLFKLGTPDIDFICRYDLLPSNHLM